MFFCHDPTTILSSIIILGSPCQCVATIVAILVDSTAVGHIIQSYAIFLRYHIWLYDWPYYVLFFFRLILGVLRVPCLWVFAHPCPCFQNSRKGFSFMWLLINKVCVDRLIYFIPTLVFITNEYQILPSHNYTNFSPLFLLFFLRSIFSLSP